MTAFRTTLRTTVGSSTPRVREITQKFLVLSGNDVPPVQGRRSPEGGTGVPRIVLRGLLVERSPRIESGWPEGKPANTGDREISVQADQRKGLRQLTSNSVQGVSS